MKPTKAIRFATAAVAVLLAAGRPIGSAKPALSEADLTDIATLLRLEDTRQFDESALGRILKSPQIEVRRRAAVSIGRIVNERGRALLVSARGDTAEEVLAAVAFATGQLKDPASVAWLSGLLDGPKTPPDVAREAAQALGKIRTPEARGALGGYLTKATLNKASAPVIGEALLSMGRFQGKEDVAPITRWATADDEGVRWRAAWALFRPGDPAAVPTLLKMIEDKDPEVRFWAARGLAPAVVDQAELQRPTVSAKLLALTTDKDRRVRAEALRALLKYDDDAAFGALLAALESGDTWMSTSAAEAASRFQSRGAALTSKLVAAAAATHPLWLRNVLLTPLITLAPEAAIDVATSLARENSVVARASAVSALTALGAPGRARLDALNADPALKGLLPAPRGGGPPGGGGGGGAGAAANRPAPAPRTDADYRRMVDRWIVPDYSGKSRPRVIWETPRGTIEIEVFAGDAPIATEYLMKSIESGDIVGTEFGRLVPNFVAQQQRIKNAPTLRDEVNQRGLTRANVAWASSGLDTGPPGFTLAHTVHPHIEGDFTALGRVVKGLDAMDKLELGDKILGARIK